MAGKVLDVERVISPDNLAAEIARRWQEWHDLRRKWLDEKRELRNYVYATDTKTTSNKKLDWSNSTTTPKLTQIYDNLKANYSAALFPNANWMRWKGSDKDSNKRQKSEVIQSYLQTKMEESAFDVTADKLLDDFILYGNCFATIEWVEDIVVNEDTGETHATYIGPKVRRISPYDLVINPAAPDFESTPKIERMVVQLGELKALIENGEEQYQPIFDRMMENRRAVASTHSYEKADAFIADGFGTIEEYYGSSYVELLIFYGDFYDTVEEKLHDNRKIVVADRAYIISNDPIASWLGREPIFHAGWRSRPDNLYAMGPLDNLVGMQYRIDHLENLKADVFDQIALPMVLIQGDVDDFEFQPGEKIYVGEEGSVGYLNPDPTVLNADFQIQQLENKMEEMAGAPRQAMGIRTPGEKTAFEVNALQTAASRIFQHKAEKLEREFLQPLLQGMLESARRNMDTSDVIRIVRPERNIEVFETITKDDIVGSGRIKPIGASHFAERAQRVQNIQQMMALKSDPSVAPHLSGKKVAEILAFELGEMDLFGENIAVQEQLATQQAAQDAEAQNMEDLEIAAENGL